MVNQAKIDVLKLNDGKGNMAFYSVNAHIQPPYWPDSTGRYCCVSTAYWYAPLAGMPAHTLLGLYATSVILTALCIQKPISKQPATPIRTPAISFCIQVLIWTMLGCAIATFNALTFDFLPAALKK
ncbi:hypothetical protein [Aliamphritea spongicola]|nr:hypothetical protein [Aliamphritea spongicola]